MSGSFLTSYTTDRIRHALPIVPFALRDGRVQRFEYLLFTELGNELFQLALNFISNWCPKLRRNIYLFVATGSLWPSCLTRSA